MEVLDTSIANVALAHIAGNLGATNDESTWMLTSDLVSNAIVLPISGWLVGVLGRKRFFLTCIVLFTVSSFLCAIAASLGLLLFRVLQCAFGGGLQPMAHDILGDSFPPEKRGLAFALSRPAHSPDIPFDNRRIVDTDQLAELDSLPKEIIVVGAGVVGLKYVSFMAALGAEVTLIDQRPVVHLGLLINLCLMSGDAYRVEVTLERGDGASLFLSVCCG
jgi:hypothetical protein